MPDNAQIAAQLRAIADQLEGKPAAVAETEPTLAANWVRVHPPYPRAEKFRDYPDPRFVSNAAGVPVTTILGYASSAQELWGCKHFDYRTQGGRLMQLGDAYNARLVANGQSAYPGILDELAFSADYTGYDATVDNRAWISGGKPEEETPL